MNKDQEKKKCLFKYQCIKLFSKLIKYTIVIITVLIIQLNLDLPQKNTRGMP